MVRLAARTGPAESGRTAVPGRRWALGGAAAIAGWVGWMHLAPALGFPRAEPASMVNRILVPGSSAGSGLGWPVLVAGLAMAAGAYAFGVTRGLVRPGLRSGAVYGIALWFLTGAVLMPLMGLAAEATSAPSMTGMAEFGTAEPMRGTFMMLHLGPLAPVSALIAWVAFGAVLGALSRLGTGRPTDRGWVVP